MTIRDEYFAKASSEVMRLFHEHWQLGNIDINELIDDMAQKLREGNICVISVHGTGEVTLEAIDLSKIE